LTCTDNHLGWVTAGSLPSTLAAEAAERFAALAPVDDVFAHTILRGGAIGRTYNDMAVYNCMTRARGVQLYEWNEQVHTWVLGGFCCTGAPPVPVSTCSIGLNRYFLWPKPG
jgi:hypothetical protein